MSICPGGGFRFLAKGGGIEEAEGLRARDVAASIRKHRLMDTRATEAEFHKEVLQAALLKAIEDRLKGGERPGLPADVRKSSALAVADSRRHNESLGINREELAATVKKGDWNSLTTAWFSSVDQDLRVE